MITPNGHKVLVKPDETEKKSKGGIIFAGVDERLEKANMQVGMLVAYGKQAWRAFSNDFTGLPWAEVGDYVLWSRFAGKIIIDPVDGEEYMILNDEDIIARITKGSNEIPENRVIGEQDEQE